MENASTYLSIAGIIIIPVNGIAFPGINIIGIVVEIVRKVRLLGITVIKVGNISNLHFSPIEFTA